jgi:type II secretory pathway pseudopilin PulG
MRIGRDLTTRQHGRQRSFCVGVQHGFTYVVLLAILALLGASLAALGTAWSTAKQRENERELQFRGDQIRAAIGRYRAAVDPPALPPTLEALLEDRRGPQVRHHLRRLWPDPFTRRADWVLIYGPDAGGGRADRGIAGVHSRSDSRRLALAGAEAVTPDVPKVSDWVFVVAAVPSPGPAASSASTPNP